MKTSTERTRWSLSVGAILALVWLALTAATGIQERPEPILLRVDLTDSYQALAEVSLACPEGNRVRRMPVGVAEGGQVTDLHLPVGELYACDSGGALVFQYQEHNAAFMLRDLRRRDQEMGGLGAMLVCPGRFRTGVYMYPLIEGVPRAHLTCEARERAAKPQPVSST